jgi:hypothetical protein
MGEIVNLRRARKGQARQLREADASANRIAFGRSKNERALADATAQLKRKRLDAHRLADGEAPDEDRR